MSLLCAAAYRKVRKKGGSFSPYRKQVKHPSCDPHSPSTPCPPTVPLCHGEIEGKAGGWVVPVRRKEKSAAPVLPRQGSELCSHYYVHMIVNIPLLYVCAVRRRQHTSSSRPPPVAPIRLHNKIPPPLPPFDPLLGRRRKRPFRVRKGSWLTCKQSTHKGESGDRCGFINFRIQLVKSNSFPEHFFENNLSNHSNECKIALSVEGIGWSFPSISRNDHLPSPPLFGLAP